MKKLIFCLTMMLLTTSLWAGEKFSRDEIIKPLLKQVPDLQKFIMKTLEMDETGLARQIDEEMNPRLAGKFIGPYMIDAKPKKSKGPNLFRLTFKTELLFIDDKENLTNVNTAFEIKEVFTSLEIVVLQKKYD